MRFLVAFGHKGWQVIDTRLECEVVSVGTLSEMQKEAKELNDLSDEFTPVESAIIMTL